MKISYIVLIVGLLLIDLNCQIQTINHITTNDSPSSSHPCPTNSAYNQKTKACECARGYKKQGQACKSICLPEQIITSRGKCCTITAFNPNYAPSGKVKEVNGLKVYISGKGSKALILFSDIFGAQSGKHKNIADTYACLGFKVYLMQFLDPPYKGSVQDLPKIFEVVQMQKVATVKARYQILRNYIKGQGCKTILAAGFCWGAWAAFKIAAEYDDIKAIAGVHPSLNVQTFYNSTEVELVKSVKCPAFFYPCSNDQPAAKKGGEYVKILADKFGEDKVGSQEFPDQKHGFMMKSQFENQFSFRDTKKILELSTEYLLRFA